MCSGLVSRYADRNALEAFRRGEITRGKLQGLAHMVDLGPDELTRLLHETGLDVLDDGEVLSAAWSVKGDSGNTSLR